MRYFVRTLAIILCVTASLLIVFYIKGKESRSQGNWHYVPVKQSVSSFQQSQLNELEKTPIAYTDPKKVIFQQWENNALAKIVVPLIPIAYESIDNDSSAKKLRISSSDYQMRIFHVEGVNDSTTACSNVIGGSPNKQVFTDYDNVNEIQHSRGAGKSWEFRRMIAENTVQTFPGPQIIYMFCLPHGASRIWIVEMYLSKQADQDSYGKSIRPLIDSFAFVD